MTLRLLAALLLLAIAVAYPWPRQGVDAQTPPVVGLDLDSSGNTATSLGPIDSCTRVHAGDQFDVDVYVKDVPPIDGVQVTVRYDPAILRPVSRDVKLFLNVKPNSNVSDFQKPVEVPGEYLVAGFDFGEGAAEPGSGAAIRITFEALAAGTSDLRATDFMMVDAGGAPVQPADAGGRFTGTVTGGGVAVDAVCGTGPAPSPQAGNTPAPAGGTATAVSTASDLTPGAASTGTAETALAASTGTAETAQAASTGTAETAQAGSTAGVTAEPTFRREARAASKTPGRSGDSGATEDQQRGDGGDGFSPLWWLPIGVGVLLLAGGAAVAWRRYGQRRGPDS